MKVRAFPNRSFLSAVAFLTALSSELVAQTGTVTGKVTDAANQRPLSDVRVTVIGTALSTQTTADGDYRLTNLRPGRLTIQVFRLGYRAGGDTVRVVAGQTTTLNIALAQSLVTLSELVITGTAGNQERKAQSAQVASISAPQLLRDAPVKTIGELLQSRAPSVAINSNSGVIGSAS